MLSRASGISGKATEKLRRKRRRHRKALHRQRTGITLKSKKCSRSIATFSVIVLGWFLRIVLRLFRGALSPFIFQKDHLPFLPQIFHANGGKYKA
jgi:hypothetical protein